MISFLSVKNIALIQDLSVEFKKGLNILSGETGAGKSIIIDSINFVLGDRADRSLIRNGETTAKVEVIFSNIKNYNEVSEILKEMDIDGEDENVIVSRMMTIDRSECRINRKIVNLSLLRKIVSLLVDTHTQNEHQNLLKVSEHIKILDSYSANIGDIINDYRKSLSDYYNIIDKLKQLPSAEERERQIEILTFQINEIEKISWQENEEEELKQKRDLYYNSQKIYSSLATAYEALNGDNGFSGITALSRAVSSLHVAAQFDSDTKELLARLESVSIEISDIAETIYDKNTSTDISEINIDQIERRIDDIRLIKKKYGKTFYEVEEFYNKAIQKLDLMNNAEAEIIKLKQKKEELELILIEKATVLHNERIKTSKVFTQKISANLSELGMKNAIFEVKFDFDDKKIVEKLNNNGAETIEFMLSTNLGEPIKSLSKVASGGEMSRFMLAIKNVIAETDNIDTLIFDEIDTGISGVIAKVVAQKLYDIARSRQVIAITHLPQLCSMGDVNYLIEKKVVNGKTNTFLQELNENEVYSEIMRLSGAVENSKIGFSNAKELKDQANKYKNNK